MEVDVMNAEEFLPGQRVVYVPNRAHGDHAHADCERGVVTGANAAAVFVRYYGQGGELQAHSQATAPGDLVVVGGGVR